MTDAALRAITASLLLATCLTGPAPTAEAQDADARARELYLRGDRHYAEGRYEEAVEAFRESYELSGRPLLLFNLANAYERLGRYEEALAALRDYAPHAPVEEEDQIRTRIANLTRRAEERAAADRGDPNGARGDGTTDGRATDAGTTGTDGAGTASPPPGGHGPPDLFVAGAITGVVGVATIVAGAVFGGLALDARGEAETHCATVGGRTLCTTAAEDALGRDDTYAVLADVGLFGGLGLATLGAILAVVGLAQTRPDDAVLPSASIGPHGGEVGLVGRF